MNMTGIVSWLLLVLFATVTDTVVIETRDVQYGLAENLSGVKNVLLLMDVYVDDEHQNSTAKPAMIVLHGGAFRASFTKRDAGTIEEARAWTQNGFVAFSVEYRRWLTQTNNQVRIHTDAVHDVLAAVRFIRANSTHYGVDPARIAVSGLTSGGAIATHMNLLNLGEGESGTPGGNHSIFASFANSGSLSTVLTNVAFNAVFRPHFAVHDVTQTTFPVAEARNAKAVLDPRQVRNELWEMPGSVNSQTAVIAALNTTVFARMLEFAREIRLILPVPPPAPPPPPDTAEEDEITFDDDETSSAPSKNRVSLRLVVLAVLLTFTAAAIIETRDVRYGTAADLSGNVNVALFMDVYVDDAMVNVSGKPAMMVIHGGAFIPRLTKRASNTVAEARAWAQQGYAAFAIEYRRWNTVARVSQARRVHVDPVLDTLTAVRFVRANYGDVDPARIGLSGTSAGGITVAHTMLLDLGDDTNVTAGIAQSGGVSPWLYNEPWKRRAEIAPYLGVHNERDPTVPFEQALATHRNLTALGVTTHELIALPGRDHTPDPFSTGTMWADMVAFMAEHMRQTAANTTSTGGDDDDDAQDDDELFFVVPPPSSSAGRVLLFETTTLLVTCLATAAGSVIAGNYVR